MIKILFFDFDGTISDARNLVLRNLMKIFDNYGYNFPSSRIKKLLGIKIPNILQILSVKPKEMNKIRKEFYSLLIKGIYSLKLCIPVAPLWKLKKKYKMIVISNSESSFIKKSAKQLKVDRLFNEIYGAEGFSSKDKLLKKLFRKYKIKPNQAVYIGDRYSDIEYARKAGCWAVSIHNKCSWSSVKEIKVQKPDFIIQDFSELNSIIKKINNL